MSNAITFTKPSDKIPLPIVITIDAAGVGVMSNGTSIQDTVTWAGDSATITKTTINDKLQDIITARDRAAREGGGAGASAAVLAAKQAATTKMETAIGAATPDSISDPKKQALLALIANAVDIDGVNAIVIPDESSDAADITTALNALVPEVSGGKRRRKTNKRARKGKRGTRRNL